MESREDIEQKRQAVVQEMLAIKSMRRGSITEQFLKVKQKGETEPVLRGPYFVFSRREGTRTVSQRLTSPQQVSQAEQEIAAFKKFQELCKEFEVLTERLGSLAQQDEISKEKKTRNSPSKRTKK